MFCGGFFPSNITININGSRCYPCYTPFLCGFSSMNRWAGMFSPLNFLSYNAGVSLGNFAAGRVFSLLC